MPNCPDCGRETDYPARCAGCAMVERALTPPGGAAAIPSRPRRPATVPPPTRAAGWGTPTPAEPAPPPPARRVSLVLVAGLAVGFLAGVAVAWLALAR